MVGHDESADLTHLSLDATRWLLARVPYAEETRQAINLLIQNRIEDESLELICASLYYRRWAIFRAAASRGYCAGWSARFSAWTSAIATSRSRSAELFDHTGYAQRSLLVSPLVPPGTAIYIEYGLGLGALEWLEINLDHDFVFTLLANEGQTSRIPEVRVVAKRLDFIQAHR